MSRFRRLAATSKYESPIKARLTSRQGVNDQVEPLKKFKFGIVAKQRAFSEPA